MTFRPLAARFWQVGVLVVLLCTLPIHASSWLREVAQFENDEGIHELEVVLGQALNLKSNFVANNEYEYTALADAVEGTVDEGWQSVQLNFDEQEIDLKRVLLEGSVNKGFSVTLEFRRKVALQALPQYSPTRISVLYTDKKTYRTHSRFSLLESGADYAPVAVRIDLNDTFTVASLPEPLAGKRMVYRVPSEPDRLRIGFYATKTAAEVDLRSLRGNYPKIDLVRVSAGEIEFAKRFNLYTSRILAVYQRQETNPDEKERDFDPNIAIRTVTPATIGALPEPAAKNIEWDTELDRSLLDEAREAFLDKDFNRAIALYTKASGDARLREESMELLAVSREKNGQLAHAKGAYQEFLQAFPESAAASRVQQRLNSLMGDELGIASLREAKRTRSLTWSHAGNVSQFYRRQSIEIGDQARSVPIDALFTDITHISRRQSESMSHEARISVGHILDFSDRDQTRTTRIHRLYWDSFFEKANVGFRVGRQSKNNAGILGRFDGATATYRQSDDIQWNVIGGYLVDSTFDSLSTDRPTYGANVELEFFDGSLEISPFYIEQYRDGVLDRRAVGAHSFYFSQKMTLGALLDYDIYHQALNNLYLSGSYNVNRDWRLSASYDFRRSPYLTTSNALIGQSYEDLSELEKSLVDMNLQDIADDRTATSNFARLGIDGKLNDRWAISVDASVSDFSSTEGSLGVLGFESRRDYYLSAQLRASDLLGENSYSSMQFRYVGSENSKTSMLYLTNRFTWGNWLVHPKIVVSQRTFGTSDQQQEQIRPSVRVNYRGFDHFRLEFESGYDWTSRETIGQDIELIGLYFHLGYRYIY